jgi:hypothetical protein
MSEDATPPPGTPPLLPYASGIHYPVEPAAPGEAFREGNTLICLNGTILPPRCILCGADTAGTPIKLTLTWDSTFRRTYVSTLELRKKATVQAFLCARHRQIWSRARLIGGLGAATGAVMMAAGLALDVWSENLDVPDYTPQAIGITIAGFALVIVSLFFFALRSRTLSCSRIQEGYLYLQGAADAFLGTLPQVHQTPPNKNQ